MSGRPPNGGKFKRRKANTKAKYEEPAQPDTSKLPKLPEGWVWATIDQILSLEPRSLQSGPFGSHLHHAEFRADGRLVIGIDNVQYGRFATGRQNRISAEKFTELERFRARPMDVLVTVMATVGRVCMVPENIEPAIITKHVYRITANKAILNPRYLTLAMWGAPPVRDFIWGNVKGQTRPGINGEILRDSPVPVPPLAEQERIVAEVDRHLSRADALAASIAQSKRRAQRLRRSILAAAFQGRLVPQDPNDEPASVLLDRIRASSPGTARGPRASTVASERASGAWSPEIPARAAEPVATYNARAAEPFATYNAHAPKRRGRPPGSKNKAKA